MPSIGYGSESRVEFGKRAEEMCEVLGGVCLKEFAEVQKRLLKGVGKVAS